MICRFSYFNIEAFLRFDALSLLLDVEVSFKAFSDFCNFSDTAVTSNESSHCDDIKGASVKGLRSLDSLIQSVTAIEDLLHQSHIIAVLNTEVPFLVLAFNYMRQMKLWDDIGLKLSH